jgi:hypothetical protein
MSGKLADMSGKPADMSGKLAGMSGKPADMSGRLAGMSAGHGKTPKNKIFSENRQLR